MADLNQVPDHIVDEHLLQQAASFIKTKVGAIPQLAAILGSGLGPFADAAQKAVSISTSVIPNYPVSTVSGHAGRWVLGEIEGKPILLMQGRIHTYEGYPISRVTFPVHLMAEIGVKKLIVTNAAGGVNPLFKPGDLMLIDDHINLMFANPLRGQHEHKWGPRWPDMSDPYSRELQEVAMSVARELQIPLRRGVLLASKGPSYESAAEVQMARRLGADALTMSTVPEVITAVYRRMNVLGISCITNLATGLSHQKLDHAEVTETANRISETFARLMRGIVREIG
ncbi:MAG: purine-nucleoside phosphorylase [candidate division KSB1 bacterium]|nr:purine-nucleoside phosphorylase [candidate division KSB1 bacterium]MDZ7365101.1 purine-nucleoside phosphorylase [candidate division KSB1 bacterium]MDZ7404311.1 purine-nucleoside phosphorylase [candidate division KSB1 bacterium]